MTPERFLKADKVFNALNPKGGEVPLQELAAAVEAWDKGFSAASVEATFHTCGATLGRVDRQAFYRWVYTVWSSLSDQVCRCPESPPPTVSFASNPNCCCCWSPQHYHAAMDDLHYTIMKMRHGITVPTSNQELTRLAESLPAPVAAAPTVQPRENTAPAAVPVWQASRAEETSPRSAEAFLAELAGPGSRTELPDSVREGPSRVELRRRYIEDNTHLVGERSETQLGRLHVISHAPPEAGRHGAHELASFGQLGGYVRRSNVVTELRCCQPQPHAPASQANPELKANPDPNPDRNPNMKRKAAETELGI